MYTAEMEIIQSLAGVAENLISLRDDGFMSRGYVIDDGRLVFKFKKRPDTTYVYEAQNLDELNRQDLGVHLQRVAYKAEDDSYLGVYGVPGISLEQYPLDGAARAAIGRQLGEFLQKLHALKPKTKLVYPLDDLIGIWQKRYRKAKKTLAKHFDAEDLARIDTLMMREMPDTLQTLGEKRVFSHADLGDGNILIDRDGKVGVIDFSESGFIDEASDFMDITDPALCAVMLDTYGADANLRKKVEMQRWIRPIFVLDVYADRDKAAVQRLIRQIRLDLDRKKGEQHVVCTGL